jgi:ABC-type lipoprotein export system ATPase subunit
MISCYQLTVPGTERTGPLFEDVSFEVEEGEWVEFVGPAASGKTALYRVLGLEARPLGGRLVIGGRNLARLDEAGLVELRREMGTCREDVELLEDRSVIENLVVPLVVRGKASRASDAADRLLDRAGIASLRDIPVGELSAGERRLVGLLRAAIGRPRAILIDGGLGRLDGQLLEAATEALVRSHQQGSAVYLFGRHPTERAPEDRRLLYLDRGTLHREEP